MMNVNFLAFLGPIGWQELIILAILGLLIFGKRLPEVGKSLGKGIVSFKKGLQGVEDEIEAAGDKDEAKQSEPAQLEDKSSEQHAVSTNIDSTEKHALV